MNLDGAITESITLQTWNISESSFDNDFVLVLYPKERSIPKFIISDMLLNTKVTLKKTKMFHILGNVTSHDFLIESLRIVNSELGSAEAAYEGSLMLFEGGFKNLKI